MREQFEKLLEIANVLENEDTEWIDRTRRYVGYDTDFANGAWYAFQVQQKKIDDLNLKIQDLIIKYEGKTTLPVLDQWSDCFVKSAKGIVNDLEELLK